MAQGDSTGLNPWTVVRETGNARQHSPRACFAEGMCGPWYLLMLWRKAPLDEKLSLFLFQPMAPLNEKSANYLFSPLNPCIKTSCGNGGVSCLSIPLRAFHPAEARVSHPVHQTSLTNLSLKTFEWLIDGRKTHWRKSLGYWYVSSVGSLWELLCNSCILSVSHSLTQAWLKGLPQSRAWLFLYRL